MDKFLAVNVYDLDQNAIPGASVTYTVKFNGKSNVLGPIDVQGIKDQPASIQLPPHIDDPVVEVVASYGEYTKSVLVDTRQTVNLIITLNTRIDNVTSGDESVNPWQVLNAARKAVPAVNYALGVAGVGAAGAFVNLFLGPTKASVVVLALVFIGMLLLFVFAQLVGAKSASVHTAGVALLWAVLLFFIAFLIFTVTAFASEWPTPWARFLGISSASASSSEVRKPQPYPSIPGGTGWVFLGYYNTSTGNFTEGPKAEVIWSGSKEVQHFFQTGNTIRLKLPSKVIIVDFATMGAQRNLDSPVTKGIISRSDETGIVIPAGAELILRDVSRGAWPGNPDAAIWGRVVYADQN